MNNLSENPLKRDDDIGLQAVSGMPNRVFVREQTQLCGGRSRELRTSRMSVLRGRPPVLAGGMWFERISHCSSVRSDEYGILAIVPPPGVKITPNSNTAKG